MTQRGALRELDVPGNPIQDIAEAALLHDTGKVGLSLRVLEKPGPLTTGERATVQRHCVLGAEGILSLTNDDTHDATTASVAVALSLHEWWDGGRYPFELSDTAIPQCARMVAVADVFDALMTDRAPVQACVAPEGHGRYVASQRTRQFDPECADAMLRVVAKLSRGWIRRFRRGEIVVKQGTRSNALFILLTGRVRLLAANSHGREVILALLPPGDYVGEMSLIDDEAHSATVRAEVQTDRHPSTCLVSPANRPQLPRRSAS